MNIIPAAADLNAAAGKKNKKIIQYSAQADCILLIRAIKGFYWNNNCCLSFWCNKTNYWIYNSTAL